VAFRCVEFASLEDLAEHVRRTLCDRQDLQPGEYPLRVIPLRTGGTEVGLLFVQHGPRMTQLVAVWDHRCGAVHYYDCDGTRFLTEQARVVSPQPIDFSIAA